MSEWAAVATAAYDRAERACSEFQFSGTWTTRRSHFVEVFAAELQRAHDDGLSTAEDICREAMAQHFDGEISEGHAEAARIAGRIRALLDEEMP